MKYRKVPVDKLIVDERYQRDIIPSRVKKIVEDFNPHLLGALVVSQRNGKFAVIDGQHRFHALRALKVDEVACLALEGLERTDEAAVFVGLNTARKQTTPLDNFKARLFQGERVAHAINKIVEEAGFYIGKSGAKNPNAIAAVTQLEHAYKDSGPEALAGALVLIRDLWGGMRRSTAGPLIIGVARLYAGYHNRLDEAARARLADTTPTKIVVRAREMSLGYDGSKSEGIKVFEVLRKAAGMRGRPLGEDTATRNRRSATKKRHAAARATA